MWLTAPHFAPGFADSPARASLRQKLAAALAIVFLIAAGTIFYFTHSRSDVHGGTDWNARLQCAACGHQFDANVEMKFPIQPHACPKCGKRDAWEMKYCSACKSLFLPPVVGDPPHPQPMPPCPKCKDNKHVGAYVPGVDMVKIGL